MLPLLLRLFSGKGRHFRFEKNSKFLFYFRLEDSNLAMVLMIKFERSLSLLSFKKTCVSKPLGESLSTSPNFIYCQSPAHLARHLCKGKKLRPATNERGVR